MFQNSRKKIALTKNHESIQYINKKICMHAVNTKLSNFSIDASHTVNNITHI